MRMLSIIASTMIGSVGGLTFLNNPFHQIVVRARTVPVQPNTNAQVFSRAAFSAAVVAWDALNTFDKQFWAAYASTVTYSGPLGNYHPTGRMLAIAQYQVTGYLESQIAVTLDGGVSMVPPVKPGQLIIDNPVFTDLAAPGIGFGISLTNLDAEDVQAYLAISHQQHKARFFFKGPFNTSSLIATEIAGSTSGLTEFTGLEDLGVYFVRMRFITDSAPRRISQELILRVLARETSA